MTGASGTVTRALTPLNESALPNLPSFVHVALRDRPRVALAGRIRHRGAGPSSNDRRQRDWGWSRDVVARRYVRVGAEIAGRVLCPDDVVVASCSTPRLVR